ncbi:MAG: hypothetical protein GF334_06340 [Candidatus Altiarchaeales archaeon]|nr:hypothetical protein [Candidatus Altiarchaeales archaeon]
MSDQDEILGLDDENIVREPQEDDIVSPKEVKPFSDEELQIAKDKEESIASEESSEESVEDEEGQGLDGDDISNLIIDNENELPDQHPVLNQSLVNNPSQLVSSNIKPGQPLQKAIENPTRTDRLLIAVRHRQPTSTLLNKVMEEVAEEAAYLKAYREKHWNGDEDISDISTKRVRMLRSMVETLIEREKQKEDKVTGKIDFYSDNFQNVLKFFLQVIEETFKKVNIPKQFADNFFTELAKEFDGFEKKAEKIYYGKSK